MLSKFSHMCTEARGLKSTLQDDGEASLWVELDDCFDKHQKWCYDPDLKGEWSETGHGVHRL